ncbi:MAG: prepilin-type N-terminal cleavage/methylation domain-containing protein [Planctomycetota bacterium]|nr:prepilin-type N-terminal cleavage/methylation domain-containing protein [Planctomycetota bacterium]MDP7130143.1 prepilin-type N-terminal cleavage/methylation domain-containing protein [Planctomycetota bacterium]MDP7253552.1 prepilin-type N-terminal cleavage/methylation domain-containing protein [Planctomycetota bacterium]
MNQLIYPACGGIQGAERRFRTSRGFTLIEMLIVIGIISLLMLLSLAAVKNVRDHAKSQYCRNNLREIGAALDHYEYLWKGILPPTTGPDDDNLRPLYPDCVNELKVFVCISTANQVDTPAMLEDNAVGGRTSGPGHSYEYLSHYLFDNKGNRLSDPVMKTRASVDIRADKVWLVMDAMEAGYPEVPDSTDNHSETGGNVLFADSHVEWIEMGRWRYEFRNGNSK